MLTMMIQILISQKKVPALAYPSGGLKHVTLFLLIPINFKNSKDVRD